MDKMAYIATRYVEREDVLLELHGYFLRRLQASARDSKIAAEIMQYAEQLRLVVILQLTYITACIRTRQLYFKSEHRLTGLLDELYANVAPALGQAPQRYWHSDSHALEEMCSSYYPLLAMEGRDNSSSTSARYSLSDCMGTESTPCDLYHAEVLCAEREKGKGLRERALYRAVFVDPRRALEPRMQLLLLDPQVEVSTRVARLVHNLSEIKAAEVGLERAWETSIMGLQSISMALEEGQAMALTERLTSSQLDVISETVDLCVPMMRREGVEYGEALAAIALPLVQRLCSLTDQSSRPQLEHIVTQCIVPCLLHVLWAPSICAPDPDRLRAISVPACLVAAEYILNDPLDMQSDLQGCLRSLEALGRVMKLGSEAEVCSKILVSDGLAVLKEWCTQYLRVCKLSDRWSLQALHRRNPGAVGQSLERVGELIEALAPVLCALSAYVDPLGKIDIASLCLSILEPLLPRTSDVRPITLQPMMQDHDQALQRLARAAAGLNVAWERMTPLTSGSSQCAYEFNTLVTLLTALRQATRFKDLHVPGQPSLIDPGVDLLTDLTVSLREGSRDVVLCVLSGLGASISMTPRDNTMEICEVLAAAICRFDGDIELLTKCYEAIPLLYDGWKPSGVPHRLCQVLCTQTFQTGIWRNDYPGALLALVAVCQAIVHMASDEATNLSLGLQGACKLVCCAMDVARNDCGVQLAACEAIIALSKLAENKKKLRFEEACAKVRAALPAFEVGSAREVTDRKSLLCETIWSLSTDVHDRWLRMPNYFLYIMVRDLMRGSPEHLRTQRYGCAFFANQSFGLSDLIAISLARAGASKVVCAAMKAFPSDSFLQLKACKFVQNLAIAHAEARKELEALGAFELVSTAVRIFETNKIIDMTDSDALEDLDPKQNCTIA